ncbi:MAG: SusC/RagA family TonB-linked outer membrane protein [Bacteroidetes bacterium]|nr:SusC/RagA family TonB-linked outer membrane protein [Bacteroidota bacterium]
MKLSVLLLFTAVVNVSAKGFAQKITLSEKDAPLKQVFSDLRKQSHVDFIYTDAQVQGVRIASLDVRQTELKEVLDRLLKDLPLTYTLDDHTVVIRDRPLAAAPPQADPPLPPVTTIAGLVQDKNHTPLSGASVSAKYSKVATSTDLHGMFQLKGIQEDDTLIVSFIGYKTKHVAVHQVKFPIIEMEEATNSLDQVVVQAYGSTTQRLTTSDIGKVSAAEIAKQPVRDPLLAIEGKVAGVVVTPQSGYEGGPVKIEIRGRATLNPGFTTDPLYVIDGVPLTILDVAGTNRLGNGNSVTSISGGLDQTHMSLSIGQSPLYNINPSDIESIDILKDADATAIYGSRGANGVILITTKKGKVGINGTSLNVSEGISFNTRTLQQLNTKEYLNLRRTLLRNDGQIVTPFTAPDLVLLDTTRYTDWQKFAYGGIGKNTNVQGEISGGSDQTTYRLGAGYNRVTDITNISGANQRATLAISLQHTSPNKRLTTSLSANYAYSIANQIGLQGQFTNIYSLPPDAAPIYDKQGNLNFAQYDSIHITSPFGSLLQPYSSKTNGLTANLTFGYTILKGLKFTLSSGYNNAQSYQTRFTPIASQNPYVGTNPKPTGSNTFGNSRSNNWILEPQLTYSVFLGKSRIDALVGASAQANVTEGLTLNGQNYTSDVFLKTITLAPKVLTVDNYGEYKYSAAYARLTYNYDNRYIVNFNGRRDGSSRFGPANRFGNFGSIGAAWIISSEKWIARWLPSAVDFLKLRGSYGTTGSDNVSDYQYLSQWGNTNGLTPYNGVVPLIPLLYPNPYYQWQVNKKLETALQLGFLQSRINLDLAYYRNRCDNQLVGFPLPSFTGFPTVTANSPANVQNSGLEATLTATPIRTRNINWMIGFNIGINRNKLLAYPNLAQSPYALQYKIGQSINTTYLFHYAGIDPMTGSATFTDYNHDGRVSATNDFPGTGFDDRRIRIDQEPNYTGGFSTAFSYKSLSYSSSFTFTRQKGMNILSGAYSTASGMHNIPEYVYTHMWTHPGQTDALYPKASTQIANGGSSLGESDAGYSDASYIRWSNIAISYSFPAKMMKKAGLRAMAFNINAYNIMVFSPYKGLDPEVKTFGSLPPARTITAGISCSF